MKYLLAVLLLGCALPLTASAEEIIDIAFPVVGDVSFSDDYDSPRSGGRTHNATDIMAEKMLPVLAVVDGVIGYAPMTEPSYGFMLTLRGDDGNEYSYVHLNNDTPGTDDGLGGAENAYVDGIEQGVRVERGEHIAWVGDSGNAESVGSHLHFEIADEYGDPVNPYASLVAAQSSVSFNAEAEGSVETINDDKDIPEAEGEVVCESDSLIRTPEVATVYYCGRDGGRYLFHNEKTFLSWYSDFSSVQYVTTEEMAAIPLRGAVTYKPGSFMIKLLSSPKVYAVGSNGTLHWVPSADLAEAIYGPKWAASVHDLSDAFFPAYEIGDEVTR